MSIVVSLETIIALAIIGGAITIWSIISLITHIAERAEKRQIERNAEAFKDEEI